VDVEVVQHQMDGFGGGVLHDQVEGHLRELKPGAVGRGEGEVAARLGFYGAEEIRGPAALVFVIRLASRPG
jgi:hypothetical protein